jgi:hypothetical protein
VDEAPGAPIRPLVGDDESLARLDAFVVSLGEHIDAIQDAEHGGELESCAKRAADVAREAAALGLPPLARAAEDVVESCARNAQLGVRDAIVALTDVVRRVRLGHRGSSS